MSVTFPSAFYMYLEKYGSAETVLILWLRNELPPEEMRDWDERGYAGAHTIELFKVLYKRLEQANKVPK